MVQATGVLVMLGMVSEASKFSKLSLYDISFDNKKHFSGGKNSSAVPINGDIFLHRAFQYFW